MLDLRLVPAAGVAWFMAAWFTQQGHWLVPVGLLIIGLFWIPRPEVLLLVVIGALVAGITVAQVERRLALELSGFDEVSARIITEPKKVSERSWWFVASVDSVPISVTNPQPVSARAGDWVELSAVFHPSDTTRYAAYARVESLEVIRSSPWWWRWSNPVRDSITQASSSGPKRGATLIPALVHGDDSSQSAEMAIAFQKTGLTHLLAVSGTNLMIVLALFLGLGALLGLRGKAKIVLGLLAVIGFVILARPEPSVLRAAAMGTVIVIGLVRGAKGGIRALSIAVIALMLLDPWLSTAAGFILSVCATAGILIFVPLWTEISPLPRPVSLLIAVPLAAQLACAPMLVVLSGEVSLAAVFANAAAGPFVAPATILGLVGGLVFLVFPGLGSFIGFCGAACAEVIVVIGYTAAQFSQAAVSWSSPWWLLALVCLGIGVALNYVFRSRLLLFATVLLLGLVILQPVSWSWPPKGWLLVACDVGQGDALVLNAGGGEAVVIDAGPEQFSMRRCLRQLGISRVRLFVLTHQHLDHYGGAAAVEAPPVTPKRGEQYQINELNITALAPHAGPDPNDPNNSSVVLLVEVNQVRFLLTGDIESEAQSQLIHDLSAGVDVLKVPHHGSSDFDPDFLSATQARIALISAGKHNDYGHPHPRLLGALRKESMVIGRTDQMGDLAIVKDGQRIVLVSR